MRFKVEQVNEGADSYFIIVDTEYKKWKMPRKAVTLNIGKSYRAVEICDFLNSEWARFNRNPT